MIFYQKEKVMQKMHLFFVAISCIANADQKRDYAHTTRERVQETYRLNHTHQTVDFVRSKHKQYLPLRQIKMTMWEALEYLDAFVDDSDPDLGLSQIHHAIQTAEAIKRDGHPEWLILVGLIHDAGKILYRFGEPQWAVVCDTFPVGCAFSDTIVYHELFKDNPDRVNAHYNSRHGIYKNCCGLEQVLMSWGHDEYLYHVVKNYLPEQAQYIIRYHSFYPQHQHSAYDHLLSVYDQQMFDWVKLFNKYDLYSKEEVAVDLEKLKPYYKALVEKYFPEPLQW